MRSEELIGQLVVSAREGDPAAFEQLARKYLRAAYAVALSIVGRPSDAEDVAQNAMLIAFEKLESCRKPESFGSWLMQIVRNQSRNWLESRKLRDVPRKTSNREQVGNGASPDATLEAADLLAALEVLTPTQKEIVLLHDLDGWTHSEISDSLNISVVMSRQHLFQARGKLRAQLGTLDLTGEASYG